MPQPDSIKDTPERRCIVTGDSFPKDDMLRFVLGPEQRIYPDLAGKLPGKGIWVKAERSLVEQAVKKNLFTRAARTKAAQEAELPDRIAVLMKEQLLQMIGMLRRSGQLVSGFEKVKEALEAGKADLIVQASDGGADGREKLARLARELPSCDVFSREELAAATGLENPVHNVALTGGMASRLRFYAGKYAHYVAH